MAKGRERFESWERFVADLKRQADIVRVAERLGMKVGRRDSDRPTAICPFHDDHRPSLQFYRAPSGGSYHCFACGAHGDVYKLVGEQLGLKFHETVSWLADFCGLQVPRRGSLTSGAGLLDPRQAGLEAGLQIFGLQTQRERHLLESFAQDRGFALPELRAREVFAAAGRKVSDRVKKQRADSGLELRDLAAQLEAAGLVVEPEVRGAQARLPLAELKDLFWDDRVLFTIRDSEGNLAGFAGRALQPDHQPKYLYSKGLERSRLLYRLDGAVNHLRQQRKAEKRQTRKPEFLDLYLVEGLLDALRLETLGFFACAVLGNQLTMGQANLVAGVAEEAARKGVVLRAHFFFDSDASGRSGVASSLTRLWRHLLERGVAPIVDAITYSGNAKDPDELLKGETTQSARELLQRSHCPAMQALLADVLDLNPFEVEKAWDELSTSQRQWALQELERRFDSHLWVQVLDRLQPFAAETIDAAAGWAEAARAFLRHRPVDLGTSKEAQVAEAAPVSGREWLLRAQQLAAASSHRREFPVDEGSWQRLAAAFDVVAPFYERILASGSARHLEPLIAVYLPKASGGLRLKALPCPENLAIQQYMLNELLRLHSERPLLAESIPAVRFDGRSLRTTGWPGESRAWPGAVSYAYQIDTDALLRQGGAERRGLFRAYFECWKSFIGYLSTGIGDFQEGRNVSTTLRHWLALFTDLSLGSSPAAACRRPGLLDLGAGR